MHVFSMLHLSPSSVPCEGLEVVTSGSSEHI